MFKTVVKRDGRRVPFEAGKITAAIGKAMAAVAQEKGVRVEERDYSIAHDLTKQVLSRLRSQFKGKSPDIEEIQEVVETVLVENGLAEVAKSYIRYRAARTAIRQGKDALMDAVSEIERQAGKDNANVQDTPAGKILQIAETTSKQYYLNRVIPAKHAEAHRNGDFYIHDLGWYGRTVNCLQIPLGKLLENGFEMQHGFVRPAKGIAVGSELAAIVLQMAQNQLHGGVSFAFFDQTMAPLVRRERERLYKEMAELAESWGVTADLEQAVERRLQRIVEQAMQGYVYNSCMMHARGGGQVPFQSLNFGTDTSPEGRMVSWALLKAFEEGLGKGEQPIFPNLIFKVKSGVNANPGDPNYDLYEYARHVAACRLFPAFAFEDASFNRHAGDEVAYMGCRTRVIANVNGPAQTEGRGNLFFLTLNLPRLGILARGDLTDFFARLDALLVLARESLLHRYSLIAKKKVKDFPFVMRQLYLGSENLQPEDSIEPAIRNGTLSIGFIGLAECLKALTGAHHGESEEAQALGLHIVGHLRQFVDSSVEQYKLNFSLVATPAEGLAGTFTRLDRERFGVLPGITDKQWYTNSFHVPVEYRITPWDKIRKEGPYHCYCNGGHISYVELPSSPKYNPLATKMLLDAMGKADMGYVSINFPQDVCRQCGFTALIEEEHCPRCGNRSIQRIRRITGYLSGLENFNEAKAAELKARVCHTGHSVQISEIPGGGLRLAGVIRDSVVDGPGFRLVVFTQGCPHHCVGCHNPSTWSFNGGTETSVEAVLRLIEEIKSEGYLSGVTISGGEPFAQAEEVAKLAKGVKDLGLNLWVYTGYTMEELKQVKGAQAVLDYIDVLVDGPYRAEERDLSLAFRGSRNQRIIEMHK